MQGTPAAPAPLSRIGVDGPPGALPQDMTKPGGPEPPASLILPCCQPVMLPQVVGSVSYRWVMEP